MQVSGQFKEVVLWEYPECHDVKRSGLVAQPRRIAHLRGAPVVAFVSLSPEDSLLVLRGSIPEPRYRPFPGLSRDRELDDELGHAFDEVDFDPVEYIEPDDSRTTAFSAIRTIQRLGSAMEAIVAAQCAPCESEETK